MAGLTASSTSLLKGSSVRVTKDQATPLIAQFRETAAFRGWQLVAASVMANHCHLVVGVPGDPNPDTLIRDFKAYASRQLNQHWPCPKSETWWTQSGSRRILRTEEAIRAAARYVRDQQFSLATYVDPEFANELGEPGQQLA
jgi:REP element-mobilizing transposase RayT